MVLRGDSAAEAEVELHTVKGERQAVTLRQRGIAHQVRRDQQRFAHAEHRVLVDVAVVGKKHLGGQRAEALGADDEMEMRGPPGMAAAGVGVVFAAIAAVGAQVFSTARAANAVAAAALGVAFVLRAAGDVTGTVTHGGVVVESRWISWLSPYGWGQQVRPYF